MNELKRKYISLVFLIGMLGMLSLMLMNAVMECFIIGLIAAYIMILIKESRVVLYVKN